MKFSVFGDGSVCASSTRCSQTNLASQTCETSDAQCVVAQCVDGNCVDTPVQNGIPCDDGACDSSPACVDMGCIVEGKLDISQMSCLTFDMGLYWLQEM